MDTTSYWAATSKFPHFSSLKSDSTVDVAVIGAGITGITAAYLLKKSGRTVALLDRGTCGGFDSLNTTAHATYVTDKRLHQLVNDFGADNAHAAWRAGQSGIGIIESLVGAEGIKCGFGFVDGYLHSPSARTPAKEAKLLQEDAKLAADMGFGAVYHDRIPGFGVPGVRFPRVAKFHPGKYLQALVATIRGRGSHIFEHTAAENIEAKPLQVIAGGKKIHCGHVVIASHNPFVGDSRMLPATLLQTKLSLYSSYAVGARISHGAWEEACFWDTAEPYHYLRVDRRRDHDCVIYGGEDHKTGQQKNIAAVYRRLEKKLLHLMPEARRTHHWSGQVIETMDGLPYMGFIGERQFVATGFSGNGITFGSLAAAMAVDAIEGRPNPWADLFDLDRKNLRAGAWNFLKENKDFPYLMISDRLKPAEGKSLKALGMNQGKILSLNGRKAAAYRDPDGKLTVCSPVCTHLKCIVAWNNAEKTWDCPCHGSRFAPTGEVLSGPAQTSLEPFFKPEKKS